MHAQSIQQRRKNRPTINARHNCARPHLRPWPAIPWPLDNVPEDGDAIAETAVRAFGRRGCAAALRAERRCDGKLRRLHCACLVCVRVCVVENLKVLLLGKIQVLVLRVSGANSANQMRPLPIRSRPDWSATAPITAAVLGGDWTFSPAQNGPGLLRITALGIGAP